MRWLELDSLSYRVKIPASLAVAVVLSAVVVSLGLTFATYSDSEKALSDRGSRLAQTAAKALPSLLLKDELWSAFELVRGFAGTASANEGEVVIVVVDPKDQVYVSNDPGLYPVNRPFSTTAQSGATRGPRPLFLWSNAPVLSNDDDRLGTIYVGIVRPVAWEEFLSRAQSVGLWALLALVILLPVGWYAGNRMAKPLVQLAEALQQVGANPSAQNRLPEHVALDEIGLVTRRFNRMSEELAQSEALKLEVYRTERLAAVGRLAGGVAHEINNPLAGLLNAIDTQRRHGARDPQLANRTLDLLERGLNQIRQTVAALLVEVRAGHDRLGPNDFEDLMTLVEPARASKHVSLEWQIGLDQALSLPAAQVRQVALNLILNAIEASPEGGHVNVSAQIGDSTLHLSVSNKGAGPPVATLEEANQTIPSSTHSGEGLGLWVTRQVVHELNGKLVVSRSEHTTSFQVLVPISQARYDTANLPH